MSLLLWVRGKRPDMETKFPDYTGKLAEFTVNKLIFIRSNFVNLFLFFYFLCFSDVLTSPSMPTKFVKLIFLPCKLLIWNSIPSVCCVLLPFDYFFHAFFLGSSRESEKSATAKLLTFLLSAAGFVCPYTKTKNKPWKMNVNSDVTKQGMQYVSIGYQLIPEWAIDFSLSRKFSRSCWGQHKSVKEAIYGLLKMRAVDQAKKRLSFPSSNLGPNCPKVLQWQILRLFTWQSETSDVVCLLIQFIASKWRRPCALAQQFFWPCSC